MLFVQIFLHRLGICLAPLHFSCIEKVNLEKKYLDGLKETIFWRIKKYPHYHSIPF